MQHDERAHAIRENQLTDLICNYGYTCMVFAFAARFTIDAVRVSLIVGSVIGFVYWFRRSRKRQTIVVQDVDQWWVLSFGGLLAGNTVVNGILMCMTIWALPAGRVITFMLAVGSIALLVVATRMWRRG